jgi:hypothetical protein
VALNFPERSRFDKRQQVVRRHICQRPPQPLHNFVHLSCNVCILGCVSLLVYPRFCPRWVRKPVTCGYLRLVGRIHSARMHRIQEERWVRSSSEQRPLVNRHRTERVI